MHQPGTLSLRGGFQASLRAGAFPFPPFAHFWYADSPGAAPARPSALRDPVSALSPLPALNYVLHSECLEVEFGQLYDAIGAAPYKPLTLVSHKLPAAEVSRGTSLTTTLYEGCCECIELVRQRYRRELASGLLDRYKPPPCAGADRSSV